MSIYRVIYFLTVLVVFVGCAGENSENGENSTSSQDDAPMPVAPAVDGKPEISIGVLRQRLGVNSKAEFTKAGGRIIAASLANSEAKDLAPLTGLPLKYLDLTKLAISDLSPLTGMPLEELYLEDTQVSDLSPLKSMPLRVLRMEHTPVENLSPLAGMKLEMLNLFGTNVKDISAVAGMPLNTLWLTESKVEDISILKGMKIKSLDIEKTAVVDLTPIAENTDLQRLNIAHCAATDLTPLKNLQLQRLIFTPEKIKNGLAFARNMQSIQQIGTSFDEVMQPAMFWLKWDAKQAAKKPSTVKPPAEKK